MCNNLYYIIMGILQGRATIPARRRVIFLSVVLPNLTMEFGAVRVCVCVRARARAFVRSRSGGCKTGV